jgi:predicted transcriptional regulator
MPTEKHVVIIMTDVKRAVVDINELKVIRNTGIPQMTVERILRKLSDTSTNLFKWLKPVSK